VTCVPLWAKVNGQTHAMSNPIQTWSKFWPWMGRSAQIGPDGSQCLGAQPTLVSGRTIQTLQNCLRRPARDAGPMIRT
jgi:hypothetical protein